MLVAFLDFFVMHILLGLFVYITIVRIRMLLLF